MLLMFFEVYLCILRKLVSERTLRSIRKSLMRQEIYREEMQYCVSMAAFQKGDRKGSFRK